MKYEYDENNKRLKIDLNEDIDMNSCKSLRTIVDGYMIRYSPLYFEIDFTNVGFMDSSGLGFIMGRYNLASMLGCKITILNAGNSIKKILQMSDIGKHIKVM